MNQTQFQAYQNIPQEKFTIVATQDIHDLKLDTKPVGYMKDAFRRFCKNKASVTAAIIIIFLLLFAVVGPFISKYETTFVDQNVQYLLPKSKNLQFLGWNGYSKKTISKADYIEYRAIEQELGVEVISKVYDEYTTETKMGKLVYYNTYYECKVNSYTATIMKEVQLTKEAYVALQNYQDENDVQVIYPITRMIYFKTDESVRADNANKDANGKFYSQSIYKDNANIWYRIQGSGNNKGIPAGYTNKNTYDEIKLTHDYVTSSLVSTSDDYTSKMRVSFEENNEFKYAKKVSGGNYLVRVNYNEYFEYLHGHEPLFLFGADQYGKDIFVNLAAGARFSLIFALCISAINLIIGAIYGAIEGYYGGAADMIMERITDILGGVPFMIVVTLFKLHIMDKVGTVTTMIFAFVLTGWIGMASTTRMQFYRYKNQEYVLAARTLGAKDRRIMFKHIFPNALGTLITSCVLVIPGVIFSESSLSYLGIVNLGVGGSTSVGTLMANGRGSISTYPHVILFPAVFIALLMITFNLFGNGLRDAFNPSLRGSEE
ncbi:MAG: ABC transporter permease [Bacilli bacterium]|nr:ABC transporter permease [Bacilli bacterium]